MTKFAEGTKVPVAQTRAEIERTLARFGASHFAYFAGPDKASVAFRAKERNVRFDLKLPTEKQIASTERRDRVHRERWRALLLSIKAKLSSVESEIETFETAFYAHIVMPTGETIYEATRERIAANYRGSNVPLLPPPSSSG